MTSDQTLQLTERDRASLYVLTHQLRCMTVQQIQNTWWPGQTTCSNVRARLRKLEAAGLLERTTRMARPAPTCRAPLARWMPGDPPPDFRSLSRAIRNRWKGRLAEPTEIVTATALAARLLGGAVRPLRATETTHEIGLAALFLTHYRDANWVSDLTQYSELGRSRDAALPDALIRDDVGRTLLAVEYAGQYGAEKLSQHHADMDAAELGYVLW